MRLTYALFRAARTGVLAPLEEDISYISKNVTPTFNFARFANKSETIKRLVELGVDLARVEKKPRLVEPLMALDFENDIAPRLAFLNDYVPADRLGEYLTENPSILSEDLDDMQTRVNYLYSKNFRKQDVERLVSRDPFWLMFQTVRIDRRLGYFQKEFRLKGNEVRIVALKQPRLITQRMERTTVNTFAIKEEMGFTGEQTKGLLLGVPKLWMLNQLSLINRFNYLHLAMKISQEGLCRTPEVLLTRASRIRQRNEFLKKLGLDQFDPTKAKYVPLMKLVTGTDAEFCFDVAKCTVDEYNLHLKSAM